MPTYCYECPACSAVVSVLRTISERNDPCNCDPCGVLMARNVGASPQRIERKANFHKPVELYSIAPNTPEEKRQLEVAGATFGPGDIPLARNRAEKLRLLEVVGYVETK